VVLSELQARWSERDFSSGLHQGQRLIAPRKQAGQMTAPDRSSARLNFPLAAQGPSTDDSTPRRRLGTDACEPENVTGRNDDRCNTKNNLGPGVAEGMR